VTQLAPEHGLGTLGLMGAGDLPAAADRAEGADGADRVVLDGALARPGVESAGSPVPDEWVAAQQRWARGWRKLVFPGIFLLYLIETVSAVADHNSGAALIAGLALVAVFCGCYLLVLPAVWRPSSRQYWALLATMVAVWLAEVPFARADASVMCVFIVVAAVGRFGGRAAPAVVALTLAALFVPVWVPAAHTNLSQSADTGLVVAIPLTALAMFGFFNIMKGNRALAEARSELARLAAENERTRIARDLHDLLGHSLTTITVKAGLARRLSTQDPAGAAREIAEVEELSRRALADVRSAVSRYRDVSVAGELATGKELLRAAGITAELPSAVDMVDAGHQELFGWALREGLTNVVRHSRATRCIVRLSRSSVEIVDDGVGAPSTAGNGLIGLRERAEAAGGQVNAGPVSPRGWRLQVSLGGQAAPGVPA
jgi:two-component system, NarL family, sensor histidine kinase DesK